MDPVLLRSEVTDDKGLMTREWARQQIQLDANAGQVPKINSTLGDLAAQIAAGDRNATNFSPEIEDAQSLLRETPRVYDDSEVRYGLAATDTPRPYDDSEIRYGLAATADTPRPYDDSDAQAYLAGIESLAGIILSLQQQLDDLRGQLACADTPRGGATGTFTSADGHTITVQAGLIISIV